MLDITCYSNILNNIDVYVPTKIYPVAALRIKWENGGGKEIIKFSLTSSHESDLTASTY